MDGDQDKDSIPKRTTQESETGAPLMDIDLEEHKDDESDSDYTIDDDDCYNWNDNLDVKGDEKVNDDQNNESSPKKTIHDRGASARMVSVDCGETFSISRDSNNSRTIVEVSSKVDDFTIENKGPSFVDKFLKYKLDQPTGDLAKITLKEVRRFFRSNTIEVEEMSPLERHRRIITSPFFTDEFARENGLELPAIPDDEVREDYEKRLDEMMAKSQLLNGVLEFIPVLSTGTRRQLPVNRLQEDIEATGDRGLRTPAFAAGERLSARSAVLTSDPPTSFLTGRWLSYEYDHTRQRQPLSLEESTKGVREKRNEEDISNLEITRKRLKELGVSEEDYVWCFPVIKRKYFQVDDDQPVSELDDFPVPVIEDKITSVLHDMGKAIMAMLYDDLVDKLQRSSHSSPPPVRKGEERPKVAKVKALDEQHSLRLVKDPRVGRLDRQDITLTQLHLPSWASTKLASSSKSCTIFVRDSNIPLERKIHPGMASTDRRESGIAPPDPVRPEEGNDLVHTKSMLNQWKLKGEQGNEPFTSSGGECSRYADFAEDSISAIPYDSAFSEKKQVALVSLEDKKLISDISVSKEPSVVSGDDVKMGKMTAGGTGTSKDLQKDGANVENKMEHLQTSSSSEDSRGLKDLKESKASDSSESSRSEEAVSEKERMKRKDPLGKADSSEKDVKRRHMN